MNKYILCLANSYKHKGRCVAGIELVKDGSNGYRVVESSPGLPKWIRPISDSSTGEISNNEAKLMYVLSVIELEEVEECPQAAQSENVHYSKAEIVELISPSNTDLLQQCLDQYHTNLFGNRGKAVHPDNFLKGNHSLMFVKTEQLKIYLDPKSPERARYRGIFNFKGCEYDLPITDPIYLKYLERNRVENKVIDTAYCTLSLGLEHDGWHSKLIAAIIIPQI